jgi:hypothetical protein
MSDQDLELIKLIAYELQVDESSVLDFCMQPFRYCYGLEDLPKGIDSDTVSRHIDFIKALAFNHRMKEKAQGDKT